MAVEFRKHNMVVTSDSKKLKYETRYEDDSKLKIIHHGQRKLIMSEIQFFTYFMPEQVPEKETPEQTPEQEIIAVYAGAAPGTHIPLLSELFPTIIFHCYDPRDFSFGNSERLKVYQQYFTDEDAKKWAGRDNVLFVCDIRTISYVDLTVEYGADEGSVRTEIGIMKDQEMQRRWVEIMQPLRACLKFRCPYLDKWEMGIKKYPHLFAEQGLALDVEKWSYLAGMIFFQAWVGATSTETRLVTDNPLRIVDYPIKDYEDKLFYHNRVERLNTQYLNPITKGVDPITPEDGNDYDGTLTIFIISEYLKRFAGESNVTEENALKIRKMIDKVIAGREVSLEDLRAGKEVIRRRSVSFPRARVSVPRRT